MRAVMADQSLANQQRRQYDKPTHTPSRYSLHFVKMIILRRRLSNREPTSISWQIVVQGLARVAPRARSCVHQASDAYPR